MGRHHVPDRAVPMSISLPASVQEQLREYAAAHPKEGSVSMLVRRLILDHLAKQGAGVPSAHVAHVAHVAHAPATRAPALHVVHDTDAEDAPVAFNGGRPLGLTEAQWAAIQGDVTAAAATELASVPQASAVDFIKAHINPAVTERDRQRAALRAADPEGWKKLEEAAGAEKAFAP